MLVQWRKAPNQPLEAQPFPLRLPSAIQPTID